MELTNDAYEAINRYFSTLSYTGYKSYTEVNKLIVFLFLEEVLYGPLSQYISEKDYKSISNSLYCIYGSCTIPFPSYRKSFTPVINKMFNQYRVSEDSILRASKNTDLRSKL